jgi:hypothetical protein
MEPAAIARGIAPIFLLGLQNPGGCCGTISPLNELCGIALWGVDLAKVEVASSRLVSRSNSSWPAVGPAARWQNGYAAACKAVYAGSIPTLASTVPD